jgi:outer membrane protein assembly factor BamA
VRKSFPQRINSSKLFLSVASTLLLVSLAAPTLRAQQPQGTTQALTLTKIEFKGLERVAEAEALEKSGLKVGQVVTIEELDAAADRLVSSGLFKNLSYSVKGKTDNAVLTFTVVEQTWNMPVAFDNFIWFTDEELREAVKRKVPAFDGTAPEAGNVTEQIRLALQELLSARKIEGAVEYTLSSDASGRKVEHLFSVKGAGLHVCKLNFVGSHAVPEETLILKSGGLFDNDYSRAYTAGFVESNLIPLYRERGYLRATFGPPKVKPETTDECEKGVGLTLYTDEGPIYVWDKAVWEGNAALTPQELDAALGMKTREIANGLKIDKGLLAVRKAYGRKGFLALRVRGEPEFDDENRRVAYRYVVEEGPQYHMGELFVTGLLEQDVNNLRGRWRLLHGEVYDESYLEEFIKKSVPEFQKDAARDGRPLPALKILTKITPNHQKQTVDVTLDFKPEFPPTSPPKP